VTDEMQPWDGGPDRVLPAGAITTHLDFLEALVDSELPGVAGDDISDALKNGAITGIAAGEVACDTDSDRAMVVLWLPFFEDQQMYVGDDEHVEHEEIAPLERWRDTESAIGALSLGFPTRPIELGFVIDERVTALPWFEFCRHYDLPPQYVVARWD
jgi:hypothetical protein